MLTKFLCFSINIKIWLLGYIIGKFLLCKIMALFMSIKICQESHSSAAFLAFVINTIFIPTALLDMRLLWVYFAFLQWHRILHIFLGVFHVYNLFDQMNILKYIQYMCFKQFSNRCFQYYYSSILLFTGKKMSAI